MSPVRVLLKEMKSAKRVIIKMVYMNSDYVGREL